MILIHLALYPKAQNMKETDEFVRMVRKSSEVEVIQVPAYKDGDIYEPHKSLMSLWGKDDMIILNCDVVPTLDQFYDMKYCKHDNCSSNVWLYPKHTGLPDPIINNRNAIYNDDNILYQGVPISKDDHFCTLPATDFMKISKQLQLRTMKKYSSMNVHWRILDQEFGIIAREKFHIHSFVKHNQNVNIDHSIP